MAKKVFKNDDGRDLRKSSISLDDEIKELSKALPVKSKKKLNDFVKKPTVEKLESFLQILSENKTIGLKGYEDAEHLLKIKLFEFIKKNYFNLFLKYLPTIKTSQELEEHAQFFYNQGSQNYILMGFTLKAIRDKNLWNKEKYGTFQNYLENELKIVKSTAYNYIDLVECFEVQTFGLLTNASKLLPFIPIMKSDKIDISIKKELENKLSKEIKIKSARELLEEAKQKKIEYGLSEEKPEINEKEQTIKYLDNKLEHSALKKEDWQDIINFLQNKVRTYF